MRPIKFKAKRVDNGEWVEGDLATIHYPKQLCILCAGDNQSWGNTQFIPIIPETVCQFTGLVDRNGREIWEGDIIRESCPRNYHYEICWRPGGFVAIRPEEKKSVLPIFEALADNQNFGWIKDQEVIGNIHDEMKE